jgi:hypothetical protein
MGFDYNKPPNNIPDAIQWLINGLQALFRKVNGLGSGSSGGSGTVTSVTSSDNTLATVATTTTTPVITIVSAPKLQTARTINGVSFNGTGNITVTSTPSGFAGGDLTGTYPNPTLIATGTAGTYGSPVSTPVITTDAQGRVTGINLVQQLCGLSNPLADPGGAGYSLIVVIAPGVTTDSIITLTGKNDGFPDGGRWSELSVDPGVGSFTIYGGINTSGVADTRRVYWHIVRL